MEKKDIQYVNCAHCGARVHLEEAVHFKSALIYGEHYHCRDCDPEGKWDVPMRVVANGEFSEVVITLFKPPNFTDELFEERTKEIEGIMQKMKEAIEN